MISLPSTTSSRSSLSRERPSPNGTDRATQNDAAQTPHKRARSGASGVSRTGSSAIRSSTIGSARRVCICRGYSVTQRSSHQPTNSRYMGLRFRGAKPTMSREESPRFRGIPNRSRTYRCARTAAPKASPTRWMRLGAVGRNPTTRDIATVSPSAAIASANANARSGASARTIAETTPFD